MIGNESRNSEDDVCIVLNIKQSSQGSESRQINTKYFKLESYDLPGLIIFWQTKDINNLIIIISYYFLFLNIFFFTTPFEGNMLPCNWGKTLTSV